MTFSKQIHMKAITNNKTFCVITCSKLLSHLFGKLILSPINLRDHFDKYTYGFIENN